LLPSANRIKNKMRKLYPIIVALIILPSTSFAQEDDLMSLLDDMQEETIEYAIGTFKTTRIINGHSIETNAQGQLNFIASHRFGRLNGSAYELFGLDEANIRLGFEYGVFDNWDIGFGRSSYEKTYDFFTKYRVMRQSKGKRVMPLSITLFASMTIKTLKWPDNNRTHHFSSRLSYAYQVMIARQIGPVSLQLTPTMVHHNLVESKADRNDIFGLGAGGRVKVSKSIAIQAEYFWVPNGQVVSEIGGSPRRDALSIGVDIETGGHIFQLHFTNSRSMIEKGFITENNGDWLKGDIHFGFNISRVFTLYDKTKAKKKRIERRVKRLDAKG
jgi:hypothetical protein